MGRETKILLALLATLTGVFVGVLSMKLLVPRPPLGAGPDVHVDLAAGSAQELVAPPALDPRPIESPTVDRYLSGSSSFAEQGGGVDAPTLPPRRDPFVAAASAERMLPPMENTAAHDSEEQMAVARQPDDPRTADPRSLPAFPATAAPAAAVAPGFSGRESRVHVVAAGDSWWELAERAYGDGRLYRALFAWNRAVDSRVTLAPGTRLEIPARERLEAAWPRLMPQP